MKKGFTLIELLIVIGILAILATTVVLVLNPAQILAESRDTQRVSDFSTIQSAVSLLLSTANTTINFSDYSSCTATGCTAVALCGGRVTQAVPACVPNSIRAVDGLGWIKIDFSQTSGGSALTNLPIDPVNSGTNYYTFVSNQTNTTYEINTKLESTKYSSGGSSDKETPDGGNNNALYEVGNDPGLNL